MRTGSARLIWTIEDMIGCVFAFLCTYFALVHTSLGQRVENGALREMSTSESWIDMPALIIVALVVVVLLGRKRSLGPLVVLGGSIGASQLLKLSLLDRPALDDSATAVHNSFPSGHVTAALAVLVSVAMVLPRRVLPFVAVPGAAGVGLVAAEIVTLGWHRFSDTLGAVLLVGAFCCLVLGEWTRGFLVPVLLSALGIVALTWWSADAAVLAGLIASAMAGYLMWVVRPVRDARPTGSAVEVGGDDRRDGLERGISTVAVRR